MSKPIVARLTNGATYGFVDADAARKKHPDATIVAHQDGSAYEADDDQTVSLKAMTRPELEAYAVSLGIEHPADKEAFPNVDVLRAAIEVSLVDVDDGTEPGRSGDALANGDSEA